MLRLIYCNFVFAITWFSLTSPSFVERDFSFCSKNMYSISKNGIFVVYFRNTLKNVSLIPMLRPNYCTFEHANTSFSIIWPSLVKEILVFRSKNVFSCSKIRFSNTNVDTELLYFSFSFKKHVFFLYKRYFLRLIPKYIEKRFINTNVVTELLHFRACKYLI